MVPFSFFLASGRDLLRVFLSITAIVSVLPIMAVPDFPGDPPAHKIGVRTVEGEGEFYVVSTGETFTPRGFNYIKLDWQTTPLEEQHRGHSTFMVGAYDPGKMEEHLRKLAGDGYNTLRCFLSTECRDYCLGDQEKGGLRDAYMQNVVDFLRLARKYDLYIIFTVDVVPQTGGYLETIYETKPEEVDASSLAYMTEGGLEASRRFWTDLVTHLVDAGAATDHILGYQLCNELYFDSNYPPFTLESGMLTTVNGKTYDLSSTTAKREMLEDNLIFWFDQIRTSIREVDPTALVTTGFFQPQEPNPTRIGDTRIIYTGRFLRESTADFVDLHAYPGVELTLDQYMENYDVPDISAKPLIMGECGAPYSAFGSAGEAAHSFMNWHAQSCEYGFDGWLIWTYGAWLREEFWSGLDEEEIINRVLSPHIREDACGFPPEINKALEATVSVSQELEGYPKEHLNDGMAWTDWNSGGDPPQWVQLEFNEPMVLGKVDLLVAMYPVTGHTHHQLLVKRSGSSDYELVHEFTGETYTDTHLIFEPDEPLREITRLRVKTLESPSWVGWWEVSAYEAVVPPEIPLPVAPPDQYEISDPYISFSWESPGEATHYQLQVAKDPGFQQLIYDRSTIPGTVIEIPVLSDAEWLYWRVRGGHLYGFSDWSSIRAMKNTIAGYSIPQQPDGKGRGLLVPSPNPFIAHTEFSFRIHTPGTGELMVFDLRGRPVLEKRVQYATPGIQQMRISGEALPPGVYICRFASGGRVQWGKIIRAR